MVRFSDSAVQTIVVSANNRLTHVDSSCCASRFTWASTSDNEAQEARDKHNCRSCGTLVCHPCSQNRVPLPSIGLHVSVRVCDRCYNDTGGALFGSETIGRTTNFDTLELGDCHRVIPERQRPRRSAVVDDLSAQILTSAPS